MEITFAAFMHRHGASAPDRSALARPRTGPPRLLFALITPTLALLLPPATAAPYVPEAVEDLSTQCAEDPSPSSNPTDCVARRLRVANDVLDSEFEQLKGQLRGDPLDALVQAQRDWVDYRARTCQSDTGRIDVNCNYRITVARERFLRDRLQECETGACNRALIELERWR